MNDDEIGRLYVKRLALLAVICMLGLALAFVLFVLPEAPWLEVPQWEE